MYKDTDNIAQNVWNRCLAYIQDNLDEQAFNTWFRPTQAMEIADNSLYIQVPSKFFYEWLEEHYVSIIKSALNKELGKDAKLIYRIRMENSQMSSSSITEQIPASRRGPVRTQMLDVPVQKKNPDLKNPFIIPGIRNVKIESQLNSNYSFDNFIEGESNRLARSAAMSVANRPGGTSFNPLLVHGGVGLGKTHLAHAIGVEIKEKHPDKTVLYISAEVFSQQYTESVRKKTRNDFIYFYQLIDVLIVDDIQFLSGKPGTQDVFFHIFNHLHQNGKQVILTSDRAPIDIKDIEQRLLSRFKWGLSAEVTNPNYNTRLEITKALLYRDGVEMNEDVVEFVAKNVATNVRELEGAIISLIAQSSFNRREVGLDLARETVSKFVKDNRRELSIDSIQSVVSEFFDIDIEKIHSKSRKRNIVQARQLAMYFSKKYTKNSLSNIGSQIGDCNHATVLYACKTVENLKETNKDFKSTYNDIKKILLS